MARLTLKDYCTTHGFNMVSKVRANTNGYKYVTLLHSDSPDLPENLYLGQRYGETVKVDDVLPINTLFVTEVLNANNETRFKLTDKEGDATATLIANGYSAF